jgi:uncharacterized protein YutE (UPF0331/DUF86 family)
MTPKTISRRVAVDRLDVVDDLLREIRTLPLDDRNAFFSDRRNIWSAESCLRRSLEALFDLGRHILAKGYGLGVSEYKEIATRLQEQGILLEREAEIMRILAGYRNRLVHFYHEVSAEELYEICANQLSDLKVVQNAYRRWLKEHPERIDSVL